jgi:hypothetical protein
VHYNRSRLVQKTRCTGSFQAQAANRRATNPVIVPEVEHGKTIKSDGPSKRFPSCSFMSPDMS